MARYFLFSVFLNQNNKLKMPTIAKNNSCTAPLANAVYRTVSGVNANVANPAIAIKWLLKYFLMQAYNKKQEAIVKIKGDKRRLICMGKGNHLKKWVVSSNKG